MRFAVITCRHNHPRRELIPTRIASDIVYEIGILGENLLKTKQQIIDISHLRENVGHVAC